MTLYAHLSRPLVRPGQHVRTGEQIGIAGCTGWCTGTHLHFELRHGGVAMDPTLLMVG
jgi:murein DD-endopeptidase MepM/ murein hydrolase activator NlpD